MNAVPIRHGQSAQMSTTIRRRTTNHFKHFGGAPVNVFRVTNNFRSYSGFTLDVPVTHSTVLELLRLIEPPKAYEMALSAARTPLSKLPSTTPLVSRRSYVATTSIVDGKARVQERARRGISGSASKGATPAPAA